MLCDVCGTDTPQEEWETEDIEGHPAGDESWYVCPCCGEPKI